MAPAVPEASALALHKLSGLTLFDIVWRSGMPTFVAALATHRRMRDALLAAFNEQHCLDVSQDDMTLQLGEALGKLLSLQRLKLGNREFVLDKLRSDIDVDLAGTAPLTAQQAAVLAPLLRTNRGLCRVKCNELWLNVQLLRETGNDTALRWQSIAPQPEGVSGFQISPSSPSCDADCVMIAGLMEAPLLAASQKRRSLPCARRNEARQMTLEMGFARLDSFSGIALAAAEARVGHRFVTRVSGSPCSNAWQMFDVHRPPINGWPCFVLKGLLLVFLVFAMRFRENSYAYETGYPGALMGAHPLRMYDFQERLHLGMLLTGPEVAGSLGAASPSCTKSSPGASESIVMDTHEVAENPDEDITIS